MTQGQLFIISAPSGAGKTSLIKRLITEVNHINVSISHTTRPPRQGEVSGKDYFFVNKRTFVEMQSNHAFLEDAQVFDNYYGTAQHTVTETLATGEDVILEIDWQGAEQVRKLLPTISIFILPPSRQELEKRLTQRGQDSRDIINQRMQQATSEMNHYHQYDYLIVNDDFEQALFQLKAIITNQRLHFSKQQHALKPLINHLFQ